MKTLHNMKYLKRINESSEEFIQDLKEILLEAEDFGYYTSMYHYERNLGFDYLEIDSYKDNPYESDITIIFDNVKDCLLRLKDYLGDKYIRCQIWNIDEYEWEEFDLNENSKLSYETNSISIDYYK